MHALLSPLHFLLCIRNNIRLVFGRLYRLVLLCKKRTLFSEIATDRGIQFLVAFLLCFFLD